MRTLPADPTPSAAHDLAFPWNIRLGIGAWKRLNLDPSPVVAGLSGEAERGRILAEGIGHCAECHTPRGPLGGLDRDRWMAGGPNPDGEGTIPNITPARLDWSAGDIAYYLESGFTPSYDTAGGSMVEVIRGTARLTAEDRAALAAYLKALPPVE
jgi:mono/diheme cytochrome c family protein